MKKFSSKALLSALSAVGTIATLGITAGTAHATPIVSGPPTLTIPSEVVSNGGVISFTTNGTPIVYTPSTVSGSVIVNVSGGSLVSGASASYNLLNNSTTECGNGTGYVNSGTSITLVGCNLSAATSYTLESGSGASGFTPSLTFVSVSSAPLVVSISSNGGVGSTTLLSASQELSFPTPSPSTYNIAANQTTFTNGLNYATNSISMTDNYANNNSWAGYIKSGTINFVFSNIPSSVTSVSTASTVTTGNGQNVSFNPSSVTPSSNSATLNGSINASGGNLGSAAYSFTFGNSGNITTGTINVAVNGSNLSGTGNISSTSNGSYPWLSATPFVTFANQTVSIYGELVYLSSSTPYNEELRLVLPSGISASNVSISVGSASCGTLDNYIYPSTVSLSNQTDYNVNVFQLFSSCVSNTSYQPGDLVPIQITLPPGTTTVSQVSGVAMAWGPGISKRLPLNVVYGQASQLTY